MMRTSSRGFTLIEILLVMLMTAIILLMVSQLTSQTFGSLRFLQEKAQTLQSATLGLDRLSAELREAVDVTQDGGSLEFDKVNFLAPECVGNDPLMPATTWTNREYGAINQLGTVLYSTTNGVLSRRVSFNGVQTTEVATNVDDFEADRAPAGISTANNVFLITLSIKEDRRITSFETIVTVPGEDP